MPVFDLVHQHLRLRFTETDNAGYTFTTAVRGAEGWIDAATWPNTLLGGSLPLKPSQIQRDDRGWSLAGNTLCRGQAPSSVVCDWQGRISPIANGGLTFQVNITLSEALNALPQFELWLGPLTTMTDRQALTWRRTFLGGPTCNSQGLPGNDLPALYFYDPATQVETILAYDSQVLDWSPGRLLNLQCRELAQYGAPGRYGVGLVGGAASLGAGEYTFRWHLWQRPLKISPTSWQAVQRMTETLAVLLEGHGQAPVGASWAQIAAGTLCDLQRPTDAWVELAQANGTCLGLRAYANSSPQLYRHEADHFELMTLLDVLVPLLLYLRLYPDPVAGRFAQRLMASLPGFHHPEVHYIGNRFPAIERDRLCDVWYFFENGLIKYAWTALMSGDSHLAAIYLDGLHGAAQLARRVNHCFPLFADFNAPGGPVPVGAPSNYSVAGMFAFAALLAASLNRSSEYEVSARAALAALRNLPLEMMFHEPQQLAFGAAAAALLAEKGDQEMASLATQLVCAQLRMAYWHEDPYALSHNYHVRGMFQACASLLYPAFKEEGESLLPWVVLLRRSLGPTEVMLKFMNLGRQHSFNFFEPYLNPEKADMAAPFIPFENLGTSELPQSGAIGKEIYGADEAFWFYLIFEALARSDDSDICVVYLDLLEPETLQAFPPQRRRFIVYNPTSFDHACTIVFAHLDSPNYTVVRTQAGVHQQIAVSDGQATFELHLQACQWVELEIVPIAQATESSQAGDGGIATS